MADTFKGELKSVAEMKQHIAAGIPAKAYLLFGEEAYLKELYTGRLKKQGKKALKAGDLLVTRSRSHVGMYVGKGWIAEARINEIGWEYAGYPPVRPGDQTGNEIRIRPYDNRWHYAYRPY